MKTQLVFPYKHNLKSLNDFKTYHINANLYENYYQSLCEFFNEELDASKILMHIDPILETLNTHNVNLLIKKLKEKFNNVIIKNNNQLSFWFGLLNIQDDILSDDQEFKNILNFYGYYKSQSKYISKYKTYFYYIAPIYSKNVNDLVYKINHGKLYHFTVDSGYDKKESILRNGLKIKNKGYREYPERIYCYSSFKNIKHNNKFLPYFKKFIYKYSNLIDLKNKIYVFKIDLSKLNNNIINFYRDDAINDDNFVYTYTNIPSNYITYIGEISSEELIDDYISGLFDS